MITDEIVIISDDKEKDSDIEEVGIFKENSTDKISSNDDAIIIDDDFNSRTENDVIEVIDIDRDTNDKNVKEYLNNVCLKNRIVGEFIEKCLDLENTSGMLRVIHRTFLPLYFKMDVAYRESDDFKRLLDMKMRALEVSPNKKFSHLKTVCEFMKSFHKDRKRANFITLTTDVKAKPSQRKRRKRRKRHISAVKNNVYKKARRKSEDIIILDDLDESPAITNNDTEISTESSKAETEDVVILEDDSIVPNNSNKENNQSHNSKMPIQDLNSDVNSSNQFLVAQKSEEYIMNERKAQRIKYIEIQIKQYKEKIDFLEQQEVDDDSINSPYILCEDMKSRIVKLYKELCNLTGSQAVKKREVRFTATEDRPQLPVKILEELINKNIGSDGNPHFPDFMEVVKCASMANADAKLGWSQQRIMAEARNLFTYCGQALQDNRKKREWRYLLRRVDSTLDDPAERDPDLMQRLEANRRIAVKKECDLLEKYVEMEQNCNRRITPFQVTQGASDDEDIDNNELATQTTNEEIAAISNGNFNILIAENCETSNEQYPRMEISTSQSIVYGSHRTRSIDEMPEMESSFGKYRIKRETNVENNTFNKMLEISIDSNQIPNISVISVPDNNNITDAVENKKSVALTSALQNNLSDIRMIEVCIENNKPPEVKVINVSSNDTNRSGPLQNNENIIETDIKEELDEREAIKLDLAGNENINMDDPTISTGIVIQDVYSMATKQEVVSTQNNNCELETSDIAYNSIEKNLEDNCDNHNETQEKSAEECEDKDFKEVTPGTTENRETISNNNSEKLDVVNDNLLKAVKNECSDVLKDMQMFGDSFTATIFDIEDPFLVIEISDSSDDSDCDMES